MVMSIELRVYGTPASQGSKSAFVRNGRAVMVNTDKKLRPWRDAIISAARTERVANERLEGPLHLEATFLFERPRSHYRTGKNAHLLKDSAPRWVAVTPDIDKVLRATMDGLTEAGVWKDDAQVVSVNMRQTYCVDGGLPGALLAIFPKGVAYS